MADMDVDTFMREGLTAPDSDDGAAVKSAVQKAKRKKSQGEKRREKLKLQKNIDKPTKRSATAATTKKPVAKKSKTEAAGDQKKKKTSPTKQSSRGGVSQHRAVLGSLASNDPDFYKFLQEEDKTLLNFDESSEEEEEVHQLPDGLVEKEENVKKASAASDSDSEAASGSEDDSESDEEEAVSRPAASKRTGSRVQVQSRHITAKTVEKWSRQLESKPRIEIVDNLVKALQGAVVEAAGDTQDMATPFKVEGVTAFNAVVRACLRNFPATFATLLNYNPRKNVTPSKCKRWGEVKTVLRSYLSALLALLKNLAGADVINAILKHVTQLTSYIACMPKQSRVYMKAMIGVWCTGEETSRVLAFLSLLRLVRLRQEDLLEKALKAMYMAYVRNCKFTSATLLPMIGFMQHSLVEIFSLDKLLGYQYTFVYIRQLAIHLRNAMASRKKDSHQVVYNWQFIHSCAFFSRLVGTLHSDENIRQLTFPLIQIIIGVVRLIPTARYYPLRFQCLRMLNLISLKTGIYIPTLTHILEVIEITDFQKKMSRVNTRPIDFSCILKLSKTQTQDRAFKDGVMDQLYELVLDNTVSYSHTVGFPEIITPAISQMKQFVKTCKIANFTKLFKQLISKFEETSQVIKQRRKTSILELSDPEMVSEWEARSKAEGTPIIAYYKQYRLLRDREVQMEIAGKERMESTDKTPIMPTGQRKATETERHEFSGLFDEDQSDDSSDDDDEERFKPKLERKKKKKRSDSDDDASSLNSEEYAMLDRDVSDGDGDQRVEGDDDDKDAKPSHISNDDLDMLEGDDIVEDFALSDIEDED